MKTSKQWIKFYKELLEIEELELIKITNSKKHTGTNDYINCSQWIKNYKEKLTELEKRNVN